MIVPGIKSLDYLLDYATPEQFEAFVRDLVCCVFKGAVASPNPADGVVDFSTFEVAATNGEHWIVHCIAKKGKFTAASFHSQLRAAADREKNHIFVLNCRVTAGAILACESERGCMIWDGEAMLREVRQLDDETAFQLIYHHFGRGTNAKWVAEHWGFGDSDRNSSHGIKTTADRKGDNSSNAAGSQRLSHHIARWFASWAWSIVVALSIPCAIVLRSFLRANPSVRLGDQKFDIRQFKYRRHVITFARVLEDSSSGLIDLVCSRWRTLLAIGIISLVFALLTNIRSDSWETDDTYRWLEDKHRFKSLNSKEPPLFESSGLPIGLWRAIAGIVLLAIGLSMAARSRLESMAPAGFVFVSGTTLMILAAAGAVAGLFDPIIRALSSP